MLYKISIFVCHQRLLHHILQMLTIEWSQVNTSTSLHQCIVTYLDYSCEKIEETGAGKVESVVEETASLRLIHSTMNFLHHHKTDLPSWESFLKHQHWGSSIWPREASVEQSWHPLPPLQWRVLRTYFYHSPFVWAVPHQYRWRHCVSQGSCAS